MRRKRRNSIKARHRQGRQSFMPDHRNKQLSPGSESRHACMKFQLGALVNWNNGRVSPPRSNTHSHRPRCVAHQRRKRLPRNTAKSSQIENARCRIPSIIDRSDRRAPDIYGKYLFTRACLTKWGITKNVPAAPEDPLALPSRWCRP
jgi:hypothetical protein